MPSTFTQPQSFWRRKSFDDLGVEEVLSRIARYAVTDEARGRIMASAPFTDRADAEREHTWVREAVGLIEAGTPLPIRRTKDLTEVAHSLGLGMMASGVQLVDCRTCLQQSLSLHQHTTRHLDVCDALSQALTVRDNLTELIAPLHAALDEDGQLFDHASPGLRAARSELTRARETLKQEQADLIRRYKSQLSGAYFAEREGRFVLPLRADAERLEGTILGSSASGNTLYVEPLELFKHNNRLRLAEARVLQEEEALLSELSELVRQRIDDLRMAANNCLLGDRIAAIAAWALRTEAIPTTFADEPVLALKQIRHPLLVSTDPSQTSRAVPNDLELQPGRALILSGPNAGGKTVALQCLGLAVWLSKSGLPIPCAEDSRIGWFSDVFTDIGDDQSIARSLSTFSAHIVHLAHFIEEARPGTLILLDEIAGGTDPDEGAVLAESILRALLSTGASVATTTHYPRLKQLAASDASQFCNASVGFDLESMQPTFRLTMGIPGVSSGLAVASRFGIPESVVADARASLPKEHQLQQHLLQQISAELDKTSANRDASFTLLQETQRKTGALEADHRRALQGERLALEKLRADLTQEVKEARSDLLRAKNLLSLQTKDGYREALQLVNQAALPITVDGSLTRALRTHSSPRTPEPQQFVPGMTVHIAHLGMDGQILEAPNKGHVRVSVGGMKMSVPIERVHTAKPSAKNATPKTTKPTRKPEPSPSNYSGAMRTSRNTCDLRGKRVDQGLSEMDAFIDQMLTLDEPAAFVLHGHGTGAMKAAVREHLAESPIVRHFEAAEPEQGGDAFTVVWLS